MDKKYKDYKYWSSLAKYTLYFSIPFLNSNIFVAIMIIDRNKDSLIYQLYLNKAVLKRNKDSSFLCFLLKSWEMQTS